MSFGGGDAYLSIADGLFVPEYISESDFYNHLVVIVNVLPGSILCKTLAGIGYLCGEAVVGTTAGGFAFAVAGFACSVACSCLIFYLVYHLYDRLEGCAIFKVIKKAIRVVVSGLGDSAVILLIQLWVKPEDYWTTRWAMTEQIKKSFDEAGISIPFPQMDVHMVSTKEN